jgi:hypothetical protein
MKRAALLLVMFAAPLFAQSVAVTKQGIVVAHDRVVDLYDAKTMQRVMRTEGVEYSGEIAADDEDVAVIDPIHNVVQIVGGARLETHETPVGAAFINHELYVLERDARRLSHRNETVKVGQGAQFLRVAHGKLYVYSVIDGLLQEITTAPFAVKRELATLPYATDFETDGRIAYFTYPQKGAIRVVDVEKMLEVGTEKVGAVPVDLEFAQHATILNARTIAIADPSSKRVFTIEGTQTGVGVTFGRGVLHGLLGVGFFGNRNSAFPTGVDRIIGREKDWVAYDSSTGTVYSVIKTKSLAIATGVGPHAFAVGEGLVYVWQNGTLVAQKRASERP